MDRENRAYHYGTTLALMGHLKAADDLACADLDELTAFIATVGRADAEAAAKAVQSAARGS